MGYDGHVKIGTELDESGLKNGLSGLGGFAKKGFGVVADTAVAAAKTSVAAIGAISTAIGTGVVASVKVGAAFESEMSKVQAISGATGDELDALRDKAKEMGAQTMFSASESAQAMEYMAMAGWKTADMLDGIEGIMNLAAASGEDLATTSDIVTDALTAFGLSAKDGGHFADILAKASSSANTNVSMMGDTFKYIAPVAGALGYSAEDAAVAISLMANSGIKAGIAGTSLRAIMTRLVKPVGEAKDAVEELGICVTNSDGSMKPLMQTIGEIREKFSELTESEKAEYAAMLAGQEGMSGFLAIVNASEEDLAKLTEEIYNCDGAAKEMASIRLDNLQGQMDLLKSAAETLGIEIYESLQESLKGLAKVGTDSINELTEAFKSDGVTGMVEVGSRILTDIVQGITAKLPDLIKISVDVVTSFANNLKDNLPTLLASGGELVETLATGILDVISVLGELGLEIISILYESLMENMPELMDTGAQMLTNLIYGISSMLPSLVENGAALILQFALGIVENLPQIITAGIEMILSLAKGIINSLPLLIEKVPVIINTFAEAVYAAIPQLISAGFELIGMLGKGIINAIPTIIANAGEIVAAIFNTITLLNLFTAGQGIIKGLGNGLKSMFSSIKTSVKNLIDLIKNPFKFDWSSIGKNIIDGIVNGIKSAASKLAEAALSAVKGAINAAKNFLGIHSPSRLARDVIGKNMIAGVNVGIQDETPELIDTSQESMQKVISGMQEKAYSIYPEYRVSKITEAEQADDKQKDPDYRKIAEIMKEVLEGSEFKVDEREFARLVWEA